MSSRNAPAQERPELALDHPGRRAHEGVVVVADRQHPRRPPEAHRRARRDLARDALDHDRAFGGRYEDADRHGKPFIPSAQEHFRLDVAKPPDDG